MLRMTDNNSNAAAANENEFISIDQKRRQITFIESSSASSGGAATAATAAENANAASAIEGVPATPSATSSALDRAPMVSAPKIFAFDGLFTNADPQVSSLGCRPRVTIYDAWPVDSSPFRFMATDFSMPQLFPQSDVCTAALQDVIPAVLDGIDGCVLALGHPKSGNWNGSFPQTEDELMLEYSNLPCRSIPVHVRLDGQRR